jgi:hypothetical protein
MNDSRSIPATTHHQVSHDQRPGLRQRPPVRQFPDHAAFQRETVRCDCGWRGTGRQAERGRLYDIGVEVLCPACTRRIGVALFEAAPAEPLALPSPAMRARRRQASLALARMLDMFEALTPSDHERAQLLLASGLPLTRKAWVEAFFCGYDADSLPAQIEAHLPRPFARR